MSNILLSEAAAPGTPATNKVILYVKSDGLFYWKDDAGVEYGIATTGDQTSPTGLKLVTSARQQSHPSAAKMWCFTTVSGGTPTSQASYNAASITDSGVGVLTVNFTVAMGSVNYPFFVSARPSVDFNAYDSAQAHATGSIQHNHFESNAVATDPINYDCVVFGAQ